MIKQWLSKFISSSLLVAAGAVALAGPAQAAYPDKPVRIIVGFPPGGANDVLARLFAAKLQARLKQTVLVENKPGAASMIAAEAAAKAAPDGLTLFVASSGALTISPAIYAKINYDPVRDFVPVALLASYPLVLAVNATSPMKTVKDLVAASHAAGAAGIDHAIGSSTFQLAAELLRNDLGVKFNHVPYKGTGPAVTAVLGGEVPFAVVDIAAALPQIKGGKLRALAVTTTRRSPLLPDVPTVAESGAPQYDVTIWTGLLVPRGTPAAVQDTLRAALKEALAEPDVAERLKVFGMEPGNADSAAFAALIARDLDKWKRAAVGANIKPE